MYFYPIFWNWLIIRANLNDLRPYKHNAVSASFLRFRIHMGNKNSIISISTRSQVIIHMRNTSILYARRVYNWIWDMWLQCSRYYKVICAIHNIQTWAIQFTRYAQILLVFLYPYFLWVWYIDSMCSPSMRVSLWGYISYIDRRVSIKLVLLNYKFIIRGV